jgi:hypothetical protein
MSLKSKQWTGVQHRELQNRISKAVRRVGAYVRLFAVNNTSIGTSSWFPPLGPSLVDESVITTSQYKVYLLVERTLRSPGATTPGDSKPWIEDEKAQPNKKRSHHGSRSDALIDGSIQSGNIDGCTAGNLEHQSSQPRWSTVLDNQLKLDMLDDMDVEIGKRRWLVTDAEQWEKAKADEVDNDAIWKTPQVIEQEQWLDKLSKHTVYYGKKRYDQASTPRAEAFARAKWGNTKG